MKPSQPGEAIAPARHLLPCRLATPKQAIHKHRPPHSPNGPPENPRRIGHILAELCTQRYIMSFLAK
ncbi:MAG: hypothetical protein AB2693_32460 [Candidatus Thiodiazotropha sp.]